MLTHFYVVTITVPVSTGACTIAGAPGFGTPRSCDDQLNNGTLTTVDRDYVFTTANEEYFFDSIERMELITNVVETEPALKSGKGLASQASATITFRDKANSDPNMDSPALVADPSIANQGTYLSKFFGRNAMKNKSVLVQKYEYNDLISSTGNKVNLVSENRYLAQNPKYQGNHVWSLSCLDELSRVEYKEIKYPDIRPCVLNTNITDSETSIQVTATLPLVASDFEYIRIENDVMPVTNALNTSGNLWTLTVQRVNGFSISSGATLRNFSNLQESHSQNDEVFLCSTVTGNLSSLIIDIFDTAGIPSSAYSQTDIETELSEWLPHSTGSWLFVQQYDVDELLNQICLTYSLDIFTEGGNSIVVRASSPWKASARRLISGSDYDAYSLKWDFDESNRYTRSVLNYNKARIGLDDDVKYFNKVASAINPPEESEIVTDSKKLFTFDLSVLLGSSDQDEENANTAVIRYVQRWNNPINGSFLMSEPQLIGDDPVATGNRLKISEIVEIQDPELVGFDGLPLSLRAQVTNIKPNYRSKIGRDYTVKFTAYNPSAATATGPVFVSDSTDINLFLLAGSPSVAQDRVFVFDSINMAQQLQAQAITTGLGWVTGSTINIVCISTGNTNQTTLDGKGGRGGTGGSTQFDGTSWVPSSGLPGGDGGVAIRVSSDNVTVNVYLGGNRTVEGESYTCNGILRAPGGGDSGRDAVIDVPGGAGNGGQGSDQGSGGIGGRNIDTGATAANGLPNINAYGQNGTSFDGTPAGTSGFGIQDDSTGSTIQVFTNGSPSRYIRGTTETDYTAD